MNSHINFYSHRNYLLCDRVACVPYGFVVSHKPNADKYPQFERRLFTTFFSAHNYEVIKYEEN